VNSISTVPAVVRATLMAACLLCACASDVNDPGQDVAAAPDSVTDQDSMYIEFDAIVLSDVWTEIGGQSDQGTAYDTGVPVDTNEFADSTALDIPMLRDSWADASTDLTVPEDSTGAGDMDGEIGANLRIRCETGDPECPEGFQCADDSMNGRFCKPESDCNLSGISSIADLLEGLDIFDITTPIFIKISTTVSMGSQTCSMLKCETDNPCCNQCWAGLVIDESDVPIQLTGSDGMIGCKGTECDFDQHCVPMSPGEKYIIWGTAQMFGDGPQLKVEGFCPASVIDA